MKLLAGMFGTGVRARNTLYDRGLLKARRLARPVVSVGNISVGGSGKTPFVLLLGELLTKRGITFDVLSRGYGRQSRGVRVVEPGGSPSDFGDEPLLIARRLDVPVVVGEDRYDAGRAAEQRFEARLHLLDDGFQHRQLARDFDIVLVTPDDARDCLLPRGRLREPLAAVRRADAVVLTSGAAAENFLLGGKLVWRARRGILPKNVPPKPVAFCGIARPKNFLTQLRVAGIEPAAEAIYKDHHQYEAADIEELLHLKMRSEAGGFVTTEKDAINLGGYFSLLKPMAIVPVRMELENPENCVDAIMERVIRSEGDRKEYDGGRAGRDESDER